MGSLDGKVAIVTGAGGAIGGATAELMSAQGARVLVSDIDGDAAARTVERVVAAGGEAVANQADISDADQVAAMVDAAKAQWGRIDVLHNNAAAMHLIRNDYDVLSTDLDVWDQTFAVNVRGALLTCRLVIPEMVGQGGGSIVNTSSVSAILPTKGVRLAYSSSKAALVMLTMHVAATFGKDGIRCNAIAPGMTLSEDRQALVDPDLLAANLASYPTKRIAVPGDVAEVVVFLASDASSFVNGQLVRVEGGVLSHRTDFTAINATR